MEHPLLLLNQIFASIGLGGFGHHFVHITHSWMIMLLMIFLAFFFTRSIKMIPSQGQNVLEIIVGKLEDFMIEIAGPEGRFFFPFIATVFLFILISNLIGLIPGFFSPTANINTTLALALCTVVYTHIIGIRFHGVKYIKHFLGPVWWLVPLMLPIELMGHIARVMSLSVRLFGNIFGKELVLSILFALAGFYLAPLPIMVLGILVSFIQALVFMLLATMYFVGAMEDAH